MDVDGCVFLSAYVATRIAELAAIAYFNGWHLDTDLKIQQLARRSGLPAHDLSELIN